jgi:hypothetical protein
MSDGNVVTAKVHSATLAEGRLFIEETDNPLLHDFFPSVGKRLGTKKSKRRRVFLPRSKKYAYIALKYDKKYFDLTPSRCTSGNERITRI